MRVPGQPENGSATVLALTAALCLVTVAFGALLLAGLVVGQRKVEAAADLAALAGATAAAAGEPACPAAGRVARANGAVLAGCRAYGGVVHVRATLARSFLPGEVTLSAQARAGPG